MSRSLLTAALLAALLLSLTVSSDAGGYVVRQQTSLGRGGIACGINDLGRWSGTTGMITGLL